MCKGKNFIDFPIGNIYKTNKQAGGNVKNLLNKSQRLPADIHPNICVLYPTYPTYPQSYYYYLIYSLF